MRVMLHLWLHPEDAPDVEQKLWRRLIRRQETQRQAVWDQSQPQANATVLKNPQETRHQRDQRHQVVKIWEVKRYWPDSNNDGFQPAGGAAEFHTSEKHRHVGLKPQTTLFRKASVPQHSKVLQLSIIFTPPPVHRCSEASDPRTSVRGSDLTSSGRSRDGQEI